MQRSSRYCVEVQKEAAVWRTLIFDSTAPQSWNTPSESYADSYKAYRQLVDLELTVQGTSSQVQSSKARQIWQERKDAYVTQSHKFLLSVGNFMAGRQFCSTTSGYIGWVPFRAKSGDDICVFVGYSIPFVLRRKSSQNLADFELIGDAYICGVTDGKTADLSTIPLKKIRLL